MVYRRFSGDFPRARLSIHLEEDTQDALGHRHASTTRIYVDSIAVKTDKYSRHILEALELPDFESDFSSDSGDDHETNHVSRDALAQMRVSDLTWLDAVAPLKVGRCVTPTSPITNPDSLNILVLIILDIGYIS